MNGIVCEKPGSFNYITLDKPTIQEGQAIIQIKRIGICGTDLHAFEGTQPYFQYPRILGHELSGTLVEYQGTDDFSVGDMVTFIPYFHCGKCVACRSGKTNCCVEMRVCGVHQDGGMVEYLSVPETSLIKGKGLSLEALSLVEPLAIGAHGVRRAAVSDGDFVLVIGTGPIGIAAAEFARIAGGNVILMDVNSKRLDFCVDTLGFNHTINPLTQDVNQTLKHITNGDMPTVVIDATGNQKAINGAFQYLAHGGRYVLIGLQSGEITFSHPEFHKRESTLMSSRNATKADFDFVISCIENQLIDPEKYITNTLQFDDVKDQFPGLLQANTDVIKAIIKMKE
ncbi:MAG TPA: zinc-binding alcohol dehydrogenase family protein [Saprospiraceae bacterium]|nr:zinc-binding alcohol dehydrogenase family protein [Saprospiraceae bacterium]